MSMFRKITRDGEGRYLVTFDDKTFSLIARGDVVTDAGSRRAWHVFDGPLVDGDTWVEMYTTKAAALAVATRILRNKAENGSAQKEQKMPEYKDLVVPPSPHCDCMEWGAQICGAYESWCSKADSIDWYNSLTQEERHVLAMEVAVDEFARNYRGIFVQDLLF